MNKFHTFLAVVGDAPTTALDFITKAVIYFIESEYPPDLFYTENQHLYLADKDIISTMILDERGSYQTTQRTALKDVLDLFAEMSDSFDFRAEDIKAVWGHFEND
jgi:hypothetical protein